MKLDPRVNASLTALQGAWFATTLGASTARMRGRPALVAAFGAVPGPLAHRMGQGPGSAVMPDSAVAGGTPGDHRV